MTVSVSWSFPARHDLTAIHWRDAGDVDAAVMAFAATGAGRAETVPNAPTLRILRVDHHRVLLRLYRDTLLVVRVYA